MEDNMTNKLYKNFIGIDVSKDTLDVFISDTKAHKQCLNKEQSLGSLIKSLNINSKDTCFILETTGGYERAACDYLYAHGFVVYRVNTRHVKNFIRSLGQEAKTDKLDARALCLYGQERYQSLCPYVPLTVNQKRLNDYAKRRRDLKQILVQEKNRYKSPSYRDLKSSIDPIIKALEQEIEKLEEALEQIIESDPCLKERADLLSSFKGVGKATIFEILAHIPELGTLSRRQVAALAGVAPFAKDSGTYKGQRRIKGGRQNLRAALFMAALSAVQYNKVLKEFYNRLIQNGKKPMVALTAAMRKMIVILNAMIRDMKPCNI
jgi:transposase